MKTPKVSVIIPCYNQSKYLKECLDSVTAQTFQDFEVIIIDDGSTDFESKLIFKNLKYPKTKIIHQKNQGLVAARNNGISLSKGKYILPLDADDKIASHFLEKAVKILDHHPNIGIVGGKTKLFGIKEGDFKLPVYQFPDILRGNCLVCSCLFRRSDYKKVGGYNPNMKYGLEDWDFWLSLIETGRDVYQFDEIFLYYRQHNTSMIKELKKNKKAQMIRQIILNHPYLYQQYPQYKKYLLDAISIRNKIKKHFIKICCLLIPTKLLRHKLRNFYK